MFSKFALLHVLAVTLVISKVTETERKSDRIVLALLEKPCMGVRLVIDLWSGSSCSSKNHVSLAGLVMVGPGKLMVGHRP